MPGRGGAAGRTGCEGSGRGPPIGAPGRGGMPPPGRGAGGRATGAGRSRLRRGGPAQISRGRLRCRGRRLRGRAHEHRAARRRRRRLAGPRILDPQAQRRRHDAPRRRGHRPDAAAPGEQAAPRGARRGGRFLRPARRHVRGDRPVLPPAPTCATGSGASAIRPALRRPVPARARSTPASTGGRHQRPTRPPAGGGRDHRFGRRLRGLDQPRRRQRGRDRLGGLGALPAGLRPFAARGRVGERRIRRHGQVALPRQARDELPRDDLFDRARCALHLDAVIALQQRHHFLARGVEQLRDFVNPDCCHSDKVLKF